MSRQILLVALLLAVSSSRTEAQPGFSEDFEDGSLTSWTGETERWQIVPFEEGHALRSNGQPRADTVYLSTESAVAYGIWQFLFRHEDVNLSTASGVRVYLMADQADLKGSVRGYFLQFGTNNANRVELWRQDGSATSSRVRLAQSEDALAGGTSNTFRCEVSRSPAGIWEVHINGQRVLQAQDNRYTWSSTFGIWLKHSATAGRQFLFDDIFVEGSAGAGEGPARMLLAERMSDYDAVLYFDSPLDPQSLPEARFTAGAVTATGSVLQADGRSILLTFSRTIDSADLRVQGLRDRSRNEIDASLPLAHPARPGDLLFNEIMYDPLADPFDHRPDQPEYVEIINASERAVSIRGLFWNRRPDENGRGDTLRFSTRPAFLNRGAYALIFADPLGAGIQAPALPEADSEYRDFVLLPVPRSSLNLRNAGDVLHLYRTDGLMIEQLSYLPEWHHPALLATKGIALERISTRLESNDRMNWTSSRAKEGGTPGAVNSVSVPDTQEQPDRGISVIPSPFSPDGDGHDDLAAIHFTLSSSVSLVRIRIFDMSGRPVRHLERALPAVRTGVALWDGLDDRNRELPVGVYVILLEAVDGGGGSVEVYKTPVVLARRLR